jgi:nucleoside-diphosphate-sugar epimerase
MRVLVTGGAGFLGKNVVTRLWEQGHDPVLLVRGGRRPGLPEMAGVIDGDGRDPEVFSSAAQGCQAILHSAAMVKTHQAVGIFEMHRAYRSDKAGRELKYGVRPLEEGIGATVDWLMAMEGG